MTKGVERTYTMKFYLDVYDLSHHDHQESFLKVAYFKTLADALQEARVRADVSQVMEFDTYKLADDYIDLLGFTNGKTKLYPQAVLTISDKRSWSKMIDKYGLDWTKYRFELLDGLMEGDPSEEFQEQAIRLIYR